jgi:hypothetical protein
MTNIPPPPPGFRPIEPAQGAAPPPPPGFRMQEGPPSVDQMRAAIATLPPEQRQTALREWAQSFVAQEREQGGVGLAVDNTVRALARGTPIGSFLDEANSLTQAGIHAVSRGRFGAPFDETQAYQRARDEAFDEANPIASPALQIGGAVASAPFTPMASVLRGGSLGSQMVNAGATGLGYGTLYGLGLGDGASERLDNARTGAMFGAGIGAAAPVIARGAGNLVAYGAEQFKGVPQAVQGFERGSVQRIVRGLTDDGIDTVAEAQSRLRPLGREGTMMDIGENMLDQAGAIANQPGAGQRILRQTLDERRAGAAGRIADDATAVMGPRQNLPRLEQAIRKNYGDAAAPLYDEFYRSPIPTTPELQNVLSRVQRATPQAASRARRLMEADVDGFDAANFFARELSDGSFEITRMPSAMEWDYIKRAIDDIAKGAGRGSNEERIFGNLARTLRETVDEAISPGNPEGSIWRQARNIAGESKGLRESMEEGQSAFNRSVSRDQMQVDLEGLSEAERIAYLVGARAQLDDTMRNHGTQFGPNGQTGAMRLLGNENARDKLTLLVGDDGANRLVGRLEAEGRFEASRQGVTQNSATARRQAAQREFPSAVDGPLRTTGGASLYGRAEQGVVAVANALLGGSLNDRNARIAVDAARMLSTQGAPRDEIVRALINYQGSRALTAQGQEAVQRIVEALMQGSRPAAITGAQ